MMYGVWIDDKNTLDEYGLVLLADLTISEPEPRTDYITVPESDGDLDFTGALTDGIVRYEMRDILFELFPVYDIIAGKRSPADEYHAALVRQKLAEQVHGKRVKLWLPDDPHHYFIGRMIIGDKGGYNNTMIPITMRAEPWRYKNKETTRTVTTSGAISLTNETRRAIPTFKATDAVATVTFGNVSHTLASGNNQFDDIALSPGRNILTFANVGNPIKVTYQEAVF